MPESVPRRSSRTASARTLLGALAGGVAAVAGLLGCDTGPSQYEPLNLPPVNVLEVLGATDLLDGGALDFQTLDPAGGSTVLSTTSLKLRFDRLLLPADVYRQGVCLQPSPAPVVQPSDCNQPGAVFLRPSYDPVKREITLRQQAGDQGVPLQPGPSLYKLTVYVGDFANQTGFLSFDGVPLAQPYTIEFHVQSSPGAPYDVPSTADHFCTPPDPSCVGTTCARPVSTILQGCSFGGCHGTAQNPDAGALGLASDDLEMGSVAKLLATAIGRVAHETETGEAANTPDQSSLRFGRAMPIIDPGPGAPSAGVPSNSYLIYKLLANRNTPLTVPWSPAGTATTDPPEVARLRDELVVGMPMPPSTDTDSAPLPGEMEWLSEWILQGAPTPTCVGP